MSVIAEVSFLTVTNADLIKIHNSYPTIEKIIGKLRKNNCKTLILLQIGRVVPLIAGAAIIGIEMATHEWLRWELIIMIAVIYIILQWGVTFPQSLALKFPVPSLILTVYPLYILEIVLFPVLFLMEKVNSPLEKKIPENKKNYIDDIIALANEAASVRELNKDQARLIERSTLLSKMQASEIMVDKSEINFLSDSMSLGEALIAAHMHHHTRFPLTKAGDINTVIGYVNFKDIVGALRINPADPTLNGIKRPLETVLDTVSLSELLIKFTRGYHHIAIVKNAQAETVGMVTLEDLIEALVGDLEDEYDKPPELLVQLGENRFRAGGGVTFEQLKARVCDKLPAWDLTIDEWMLGLCAGTIPDNYVTIYQNISFKVKRIIRGHIYDVIIDRPNDSCADVNSSFSNAGINVNK